MCPHVSMLSSQTSNIAHFEIFCCACAITKCLLHRKRMCEALWCTYSQKAVSKRAHTVIRNIDGECTVLLCDRQPGQLRF